MKIFKYYFTGCKTDFVCVQRIKLCAKPTANWKPSICHMTTLNGKDSKCHPLPLDMAADVELLATPDVSSNGNNTIAARLLLLLLLLLLQRTVVKCRLRC
jgi:hypothetical protein